MLAPNIIKKIGKPKAKTRLPVATPPRKIKGRNDEKAPIIRRTPKMPKMKLNNFMNILIFSII